jgi:hypothetical protein
MYQLYQLNITLEGLEQLIELKHVTWWAKQTLIRKHMHVDISAVNIYYKRRCKSLINF